MDYLVIGVEIIRMPIGVKVKKAKKGRRAAKENQVAQSVVKPGHVSNQCWWNRGQEGWNSQGSAPQLKGSSGSQRSKEVYNIHQYPQHQPVQGLPPDQLRGFRDLRPQAQQQYQSLSQASTQCGSIATVLSSSDQGGFSGQRLNINYLSESGDLESRFRNCRTRNTCVISILYRFRFTPSSSGAMGSSH